MRGKRDCYHSFSPKSEGESPSKKREEECHAFYPRGNEKKGSSPSSSILGEGGKGGRLSKGKFISSEMSEKRLEQPVYAREGEERYPGVFSVTTADIGGRESSAVQKGEEGGKPERQGDRHNSFSSNVPEKGGKGSFSSTIFRSSSEKGEE